MQKKVLIVDDNRATSHALSFKLEKEGFEIACAYTGEEGLDQITSFLPDLVILDIRMPVMSGTELLERIHEVEGAKNVKFIILTNQDTMESVSQILSQKVTDYVVKADTSLEDITALVKSRLGVA